MDDSPENLLAFGLSEFMYTVACAGVEPSSSAFARGFQIIALYNNLTPSIVV